MSVVWTVIDSTSRRSMPPRASRASTFAMRTGVWVAVVMGTTLVPVGWAAHPTELGNRTPRNLGWSSRTGATQTGCHACDAGRARPEPGGEPRRRRPGRPDVLPRRDRGPALRAPVHRGLHGA